MFLKKLLNAVAIVMVLQFIFVFSIYANELPAKIITNTDLKQYPNPIAENLMTLTQNSEVIVKAIENNWAKVAYNGTDGYVNLSFLEQYENIKFAYSITVVAIPIWQRDLNKKMESQQSDYVQAISTKSDVLALTWEKTKEVFTIGIPAEVYDVLSKKTYYVKSFSNGNHADVETITKADTQIMFETFDSVWSWDVRPVWVTINGKTIAGSINGMPHAKGVNDDNDMDGQVCIHFPGSKTHNGNTNFGQIHQDVAKQAYELSIK